MVLEKFYMGIANGMGHASGLYLLMKISSSQDG